MGTIKIGNFEMKWGRDLSTPIQTLQVEDLLQPEPVGKHDIPVMDAETFELWAKVASAIAAKDDVGRQAVTQRSSVEENVSLTQFINQYQAIRPAYEPEYIDVLETLAIYNPDVSMAMENISLANTPHTIQFPDSVKKSEKKAMMKHLMDVRDSWYSLGNGINGFINDSLSQMGIGGASSFEMVAKRDLSGIMQLVRVGTQNIFFRYNTDTCTYIPMQKIPQTAIYNGKRIDGIYKELNQVTYKYIALRRIGKTPNGIPPMLSALESLVIQKSMITNLNAIVEKLGLMGFLKVLFAMPIKLPQETPEAYQARSASELQAKATTLKGSLKNGFLAGYTGTEVDMQKTDSNIEGAEKLVHMNQQFITTGLKQHPSMMGYDSTVSETFGRVILAKMTTQLVNYQTTMAMALGEIYRFELLLKFNKDLKITAEFEKVMMGDKGREEEAFGKKIANQNMLVDSGYIDHVTAANNLGFDEPASKEPIRPAAKAAPTDDKDADKDKPENDTAQPDATNPKTTDKNTAKAMAELGSLKAIYNYGDHECKGDNCSHVEHFGKKKQDKIADPYEAAIIMKYKLANKEVTEAMIKGLSGLSEGADLQTVQSNVLFNLYTKWDKEFVSKIKDDVQEQVKRIYEASRKDPTPLKGTGMAPPEMTYNLTDIRVLDYFAKSDVLYLGKFMTDPDTVKAVNQWIKDTYIEGAMPIGRGSQGIGAFKDKFGEFMDGQDWKISRIIDTTVNRLRNAGALNSIDQAGVEKFKVLSLSDNLACPYCENLKGKTFSTSKEMRKLDNILSHSPESTVNISPFATGVDLTAEEIGNKSSNDLQNLGIGSPPFHPHCRCTIVAEI